MPCVFSPQKLTQTKNNVQRVFARHVSLLCVAMTGPPEGPCCCPSVYFGYATESQDSAWRTAFTAPLSPLPPGVQGGGYWGACTVTLAAPQAEACPGDAGTWDRCILPWRRRCKTDHRLWCAVAPTQRRMDYLQTSPL